MQTPDSMRIAIGIFGRTNSGKSSLLNTIADQNFSIVSDKKGTTTDPVRKAMELPGTGAVLFTDTAGFCDDGELGVLREEKTLQVLDKSDVVLAVFSCEETNFDWVKKISGKGKKLICVLTKTDCADSKEIEDAKKRIFSVTQTEPVLFSAVTKKGLSELVKKIGEAAHHGHEEEFALTHGLCKKNDTVLLVMPQDIQAPKGRLILPQVRVMRELLDKKCIVVSCTGDTLEQTLSSLCKAPQLIITDSQLFSKVHELCPKESKLTSFSILMAAEKGNIDDFIKGAAALDNLCSESRILIAEACTHVPQKEDIGREKIPALLRKKCPSVKIDFVRGTDFPSSLVNSDGSARYSLIIHCGACMFNREYVLQRQAAAKKAKIPMTNYGIAIAKLTGILSDVFVN